MEAGVVTLGADDVKNDPFAGRYWKKGQAGGPVSVQKHFQAVRMGDGYWCVMKALTRSDGQGKAEMAYGPPLFPNMSEATAKRMAKRLNKRSD